MKLILLLLSLYLLCSFQKRPPRKKLNTSYVILKGKWRTEPMTYSDSVLALELPPVDSVWLNYDRKKGVIKSNK